MEFKVTKRLILKVRKKWLMRNKVKNKVKVSLGLKVIKKWIIRVKETLESKVTGNWRNKVIEMQEIKVTEK